MTLGKTVHGCELYYISINLHCRGSSCSGQASQTINTIAQNLVIIAVNILTTTWPFCNHACAETSAVVVCARAHCIVLVAGVCGGR